MGLASLKAILRDLAAPLVDLTIDGVMAAAKPRRSRSDEDLEELMELAKKTPEIKLEPNSIAPPVAPTSETEYLSFKGQSEVDYCLECCANKHYPTASMKLEEASDRAHAAGYVSPGAQKKIREVVRHLNGADGDLTTSTARGEVKEVLDELKAETRKVRKEIWAKKLSVGGGTPDDIDRLKGRVDKLREKTYQALSLPGAKTPTAVICEHAPLEKRGECIELTHGFLNREIPEKDFREKYRSLTGKEPVIETGDGELRIAFESE